MPMYFPDLKSVRACAIAMNENKGDKKYTGIIPNTEEELREARMQLSEYFKTVWNDNIMAAEIYYAATKENYDAVIGMSLMNQLFK